MSTYNIQVKMKRGGLCTMSVKGDSWSDSDGAGQKSIEVEIESVTFPGDPKHDVSHLVDMRDVEEKFIEAQEGFSQNVKDEALIAVHESLCERRGY